jgi:hypothetical protein
LSSNKYLQKKIWLANILSQQKRHRLKLFVQNCKEEFVREKASKTITVAKEKLRFGTSKKPTKEPNFGAMATFKLFLLMVFKKISWPLSQSITRPL